MRHTHTISTAICVGAFSFALLSAHWSAVANTSGSPSTASKDERAALIDEIRAQPVSTLPPEYAEVQRSLWLPAHPDERLAALAAVEALLEQEERPAHRAGYLNVLAQGYESSGDVARAAVTFQRVVDEHPGTVQEMHARLKLAYLVGDDLPAAVAHFQRIRDLYENSDDQAVRLLGGGQYVLSLIPLSDYLSALKRHEEAIEVRNHFLHGMSRNAAMMAAARFKEPERMYLGVCNARDLMALGRCEEALRVFDAALTLSPDMGGDEGIVLLRYERIGMLGLGTYSDERLGHLYALWEDPDLRKHERQIVKIGYQIMASHWERAEAGEALAMLESLEPMFSRVWATTNESDEFWLLTLDHLYADTLHRLSTVYRDSGDTAGRVRVLTELTRLFPGTTHADMAQKRLSRIRTGQDDPFETEPD
ncbi:MAG: hypothetical protein EA379_07365 [Phycisphaerales bacterium]|nr:MAG: hypothetical protein EA379_07365 [Phycisphaerales bacterium]